MRVSPISGCDGATLEVISEGTGWSSGEFGIDSKTTITLRVTQMGENTYAVLVKKGGQRTETASAIRINRSLSSVEAVPLTDSIGIGTLAGRSERTKMLWLARRGTELPTAGSVDLFASETLEAGEERSINFKVYTGEHDKPEENQVRGILRIKGTDLDEGRIEEGAKLECEFHIPDGGNLKLTVKVPDVRQEFSSDHNYYAHEEGALDYREAAGSIKKEAEELGLEVDEAQNYMDDKRLRRARVLLDEVDELSHRESDPETVKMHYDRAQEAKNLLALTRRDHRPIHLQIEVEKVRVQWNDEPAAWAEDGTKERVAKLFDAAAKAAAVGDEECEDRLDDIRREAWETLWKEDWYVIQVFNSIHGFAVRQGIGAEAASLIEKGEMLAERGDTERLREVVQELFGLVHGERGAVLALEGINIRSA